MSLQRIFKLLYGLIILHYSFCCALHPKPDPSSVHALIEAIQFMQEQPIERIESMAKSFEKLDNHERAQLLKAFKECYKSMTPQKSAIPQALLGPTYKNEPGRTSSLKAHDQAKRKFTTLYIASNGITRCFLPNVYNISREGKSTGILAICIGLLAGAFSGSTLMRFKKKNKHIDYYVSLWVGVFFGIGVAGMTYALRKNSFTKNQSLRVAQFIEHTWPILRESIIFPEHVVSILDYLYAKMEAGTFDMDEAMTCIDALLEPGKAH